MSLLRRKCSLSGWISASTDLEIEMSLPLVEMHCDGACSPNPGIGGWGAVLIAPERDNFRWERSGAESDSTNNRMELTAVIEAFKLLKTPCQVEVYTDSKYVCNAFLEGWIDNWQANGWRTAGKKPVANADLWSDLLYAIRSHQVKWNWVKGHAGHAGNERADELAVEARLRLANK